MPPPRNYQTEASTKKTKLAETLWQCPKCGRLFRHKNQSHSCVSYSIEGHFQGKAPYLKEIFDYLLEKLQCFGTVRVDAVKSSINLAGKSHFGGIHVLKESLNLGFLLTKRLDNKRVFRIENVGENRYGHHVKLTGKDDINEELLGWLKQAYDRSKSDNATG